MVLIKMIFAAHLRHSNFGPSADVKPMQDDLVLRALTEGDGSALYLIV
jgi:hypothetical protein